MARTRGLFLATTGSWRNADRSQGRMEAACGAGASGEDTDLQCKDQSGQRKWRQSHGDPQCCARGPTRAGRPGSGSLRGQRQVLPPLRGRGPVGLGGHAVGGGDRECHTPGSIADEEEQVPGGGDGAENRRLTLPHQRRALCPAGSPVILVHEVRKRATQRMVVN